MPPMKLSLFTSEDTEETVELPESLADSLRDVVDATPELTFEDALRQGIEHVVQKHGGRMRPEV
jgi:hypothetical protein